MDSTKLKVFEEVRINFSMIKVSVFDRQERIVGIGESASLHTSSFPTMFSKALKTCDCVIKGQIRFFSYSTIDTNSYVIF